jgi:hypothetical protein
VSNCLVCARPTQRVQPPRAADRRREAYHATLQGGIVTRSNPRHRRRKLTAAYANRRFKFKKSSQPLARTHDETLSVIVMRVNNPDCSPFAIYRRNTAPTPTGFAEIVSDDSRYFTRRIMAFLLLQGGAGMVGISYDSVLHRRWTSLRYYF